MWTHPSGSYWQLPYNGPAQHAQTTYYWQSQVCSNAQPSGSWSDVARFTTGLSQADWSAKWIAAGPDTQGAKDSSLPVFRAGFKPRGPAKSALLFVTGLGQYEIHINGANVTKTVMNPGWTNYRKSVPYDTYQVTDLLHPGQNVFSMLLGNDMYNVEEKPGRYTKFAASFGRPKARLQMQPQY